MMRPRCVQTSPNQRIALCGVERLRMCFWCPGYEFGCCLICFGRMARFARLSQVGRHPDISLASSLWVTNPWHSTKPWPSKLQRSVIHASSRWRKPKEDSLLMMKDAGYSNQEYTVQSRERFQMGRPLFNFILFARDSLPHIPSDPIHHRP